jgi:methylmalonyl-CoA mutase
MTFQRNRNNSLEATLKELVDKFAKLEGRQPRVMMCRSRETPGDQRLNLVSVNVAGFGFDVDLGTPFDSVTGLGTNAIENDSDVLLLFSNPSDDMETFVSNLEKFLSVNGYSDLLILHDSQDLTYPELAVSLKKWLEETIG